MRRAPAWLILIGMLSGWVFAPGSARAADGFWVTLAAGLAGSDTASASNEFWFDTPHGPPVIGVNKLSVGSNVEAATGGGNVFFSGVGTPVLLNTSNGAAYVATAGAPKSAKTASGKGSSLATGEPEAGGVLPADAALLGITLADPDAAGVRTLTASLTDAAGNPLGMADVGVPTGGWWVIGLTPGAVDDPEPGPGPIVDPVPGGGSGSGSGDPDPTPDPEPEEEVPLPPPGNGGGPVATPEPTTFMLMGLGGMTFGVWRRITRKVAVTA